MDYIVCSVCEIKKKKQAKNKTQKSKTKKNQTKTKPDCSGKKQLSWWQK